MSRIADDFADIKRRLDGLDRNECVVRVDLSGCPAKEDLEIALNAHRESFFRWAKGEKDIVASAYEAASEAYRAVLPPIAARTAVLPVDIAGPMRRFFERDQDE
jgi:hypothetical protein